MSAFCTNKIHLGGCCCPHKIPAGRSCPVCQSAPFPTLAPSPRIPEPPEPVIAGQIVIQGGLIGRSDGAVFPCLQFVFLPQGNSNPPVPAGIFKLPIDENLTQPLRDLLETAIADAMLAHADALSAEHAAEADTAEVDATGGDAPVESDG